MGSRLLVLAHIPLARSRERGLADGRADLQLCPPGQQTVVLHEEWTEDFARRTQDIINWGQKQRCRATTVSVSDSETLVLLSPPPA